MNNGYEYFNGTVNGQPFSGMQAPLGMNNGYEYFNGTIGGRPVGGLVVPGNNGFKRLHRKLSEGPKWVPVSYFWPFEEPQCAPSTKRCKPRDWRSAIW